MTADSLRERVRLRLRERRVAPRPTRESVPRRRYTSNRTPWRTVPGSGYYTALHTARSLRSGDYDFAAQGTPNLGPAAGLAVLDLLGAQRRECNVCGWRGRKFYPNTGTGYHEADTVCPGCFEPGPSPQPAGIAGRPDRPVRRWPPGGPVAPSRVRGAHAVQPGVDYTSFDLAPFAMERHDITAMNFPDDSVDCFLCFHVLEHLPQDAPAIAEIHPGAATGRHMAVLQVPLDWDAARTRGYPPRPARGAATSGGTAGTSPTRSPRRVRREPPLGVGGVRRRHRASLRAVQGADLLRRQGVTPTAPCFSRQRRVTERGRPAWSPATASSHPAGPATDRRRRPAGPRTSAPLNTHCAPDGREARGEIRQHGVVDADDDLVPRHISQ